MNAHETLEVVTDNMQQCTRGGARAQPDSALCARRTLLYGGVAMNPRAHLRLVYEANPLAFLVEQARAL